jgi:hypothetical protein
MFDYTPGHDRVADQNRISAWHCYFLATFRYFSRARLQHQPAHPYGWPCNRADKKMLNDASDSVSRREWEALVPDPIPDPSLVIDPALPQDFRKLTSADLQPVFDVDVKRETRRLTLDGAKIDVSLDDGAVIAGQEREPVHEIELELIAGELKGPVRGSTAHQRADVLFSHCSWPVILVAQL